jgi:hypothetical protein
VCVLLGTYQLALLAFKASKPPKGTQRQFHAPPCS